MGSGRAIAFSIVVLSGALLSGCALIAGANAYRGAEAGIAVGAVIGIIGMASLFAECTNNWGIVKKYWELLNKEGIFQKQSEEEEKAKS